MHEPPPFVAVAHRKSYDSLGDEKKSNQHHSLSVQQAAYSVFKACDVVALADMMCESLIELGEHRPSSLPSRKPSAKRLRGAADGAGRGNHLTSRSSRHAIAALQQ